MSPVSRPEPDRSPVVMTELVLPSHTNALGTIFGGTVMAWIDIAGAIAARRYARANVVTASIDYLHFVTPIKIGYAVILHAQITSVGNTSMEVEVLVDAENSVTGETRRATTAYLTYVALDEFGRPKKVSPLAAKSAAEKKALLAAQKRRQDRLKSRSR